MSTHNIRFCAEIKKFLPFYLDTPLILSYALLSTYAPEEPFSLGLAHFDSECIST